MLFSWARVVSDSISNEREKTRTRRESPHTVEREHGLPIVHESPGRDCGCHHVVCDERVVYVHPADVEVGRVVGVKHVFSDVRDVHPPRISGIQNEVNLVSEGSRSRHSRIRFSRDIDLVALHTKGIDEVLPEAHELLT